QSINFQKEGMTVIYGDNGTGKSSYAKILKNACLTRGEKPDVFGNIFEDGSSPPSSKITYQVGGKPTVDVDWEFQGQEIPYLKSIRIFDTKSAFHYVEKEGVLDYRPAGLHLLDELINVCLHIKSRVETKISSLSTQKQLPKVDKGTEACDFLENIGVKTTSSQLESICITKDELAKLEATQRELIDLKIKTAAEVRKTLNKKVISYIPLLDSLKSASEVINNNAFNEVFELKKSYKSKAKASRLAREEAFSGMPIEGIGSSAWGELWNSARNFIHCSCKDKSFPPSHGDICPLCLQTISVDVANRMNVFEAYITDDIQTKMETAKTAYEKEMQRINKVQLDLEPFKSVISDLDETHKGFKELITGFSELFSKRKAFIFDKNNDETKLSKIPAYDETVIEKLTDIITDIKKVSDELKEEKGLEKLIKEKLTLEKELKAKKVVQDCKSQVEIEIKRIKALAAYNMVLRY
ncbi:MAG: AAA family ATPase, partial [Deltaproteobacteria bacterium]|nr:AAA family ATPase [Deltaproteobacteria bacterium]